MWKKFYRHRLLLSYLIESESSVVLGCAVQHKLEPSLGKLPDLLRGKQVWLQIVNNQSFYALAEGTICLLPKFRKSKRTGTRTCY